MERANYNFQNQTYLSNSTITIKMAYLCLPNDCPLRGVTDNENIEGENEYRAEQGDEYEPSLVHNGTADGDEFVIPEYVCCVVTEGVWTVFAACILIIVLLTIATLKYFKKHLSKTKYNKKNLRMMDRYITVFNLFQKWP